MNTRRLVRGVGLSVFLLALSAPVAVHAQTFGVGFLRTPARADIYFSFDCLTQRYQFSWGYDAVTTCADDAVVGPQITWQVGATTRPNFNTDDYAFWGRG